MIFKEILKKNLWDGVKIQGPTYPLIYPPRESPGGTSRTRMRYLTMEGILWGQG